jgi:hypothetical protein
MKFRSPLSQSGDAKELRALLAGRKVAQHHALVNQPAKMAATNNPCPRRHAPLASLHHEGKPMRLVVILALACVWIVLAVGAYQRGNMAMAGVFILAGTALTIYRLGK